MWHRYFGICEYSVLILGALAFGVGTGKIEDCLAGCQLYCGIAHVDVLGFEVSEFVGAWRLTRVRFVGLQRSAAVKKTLTS